MKRLKLCEIDKTELLEILDKYISISRYDAELEISLYKKVRFEGYSTTELAAEEHLSRPSIYRKIKKVDIFIQKALETEK